MSTVSPIAVRSWTRGSPDLLALHKAHPQRYPHLLESVSQGSFGRFDILFAFPGESLTLGQDGTLHGASQFGEPAFLSRFDRWWKSLQQATAVDPSVPFRGGWFLYLGYELAGQIEPRLRIPKGDSDDLFPIAIATRFPGAVIRDHQHNVTYLVAEREQEEILERISEDLLQLPKTHSTALPALLEIREDPPTRYLNDINHILRYIEDGDVFQVNLSRSWEARFESMPADADLYHQLRQHNPGPYNGLATWPWGSVISSSPERLAGVTGRTVQTRPIAGTRPRGLHQTTDESLSTELLRNPKEQAEHIMLIDLERNDLGRVCMPGSVKVSELMSLESYAHVHHIVSNVQGTLQPDIAPGQVLAAVFPGGTITGCPKVRCMEIIAELEGQRRGPYTGSMGYVNRDGDMDMNILIRTMVRSGKHLRLRAGAGIVADSVPERELEETRAKARGMLAALGANDLPDCNLSGGTLPEKKDMGQ